LLQGAAACGGVSSVVVVVVVVVPAAPCCRRHALPAPLQCREVRVLHQHDGINANEVLGCERHCRQLVPLEQGSHQVAGVPLQAGEEQPGGLH
jgi:hypothetical protein